MNLSKQVVCRTLGFTGGARFGNATFQPTGGVIWERNLACFGQ